MTRRSCRGSGSFFCLFAWLIQLIRRQRAGDAEAVEALLGPLVVGGSGADPSRVEKALFQLGLVRFDRRDWAGARTAFGRIVDEWPAGPLRQRARFWQAEAAFQAPLALAGALFSTPFGPSAVAGGARAVVRNMPLVLLLALIAFLFWPADERSEAEIVAEDDPQPAPEPNGAYRGAHNGLYGERAA